MIDAALRGPLFGSMLMCICGSITGVLVFLRKKLLVGETLSHASYPGIVIAGIIAAGIGNMSMGPLLVLVGAFLSSLVGNALITYLEEKRGVDPDAALTFILSFFLGIGVLLASYLQYVNPIWYRLVQSYLYGQAATLMDIHIIVYGLLTLTVIGFVILLFRDIEVLSFDKGFAQTLGVKTKRLEWMLTVMLALSVVIGMRSVGVILMSGMLIAPAVVARQTTHKLRTMLIVAAVVGAFSAFCGNMIAYSVTSVSLPPGPVILLVASSLAALAMLFAPKQGLVVRLTRRVIFRLQCHGENILKALWKEAEHFFPDSFSHDIAVWKLCRDGYITKDGGILRLTEEGRGKAQRIVRLHRLWEVYLVSYLGVSAKRVHKSAEEIEHILTSDLEQELLSMVGESRLDPHAQAIPEGGTL